MLSRSLFTRIAGSEMANLYTLRSAFCIEIVEKKSRFVARAGPAVTISDAHAFIAASSEKKATHNCWAYRIDEKTHRENDDGEPSGTAGMPIYFAICSCNVVNIVVVVSRYFGGIKLGTGGLARAYAAAARECLQNAPLVPYLPTIDLSVSVPFELVGTLFDLVRRMDKLDTKYTNTMCEVHLRIACGERENFEERVKNSTKGIAVVKIVE